MSKDTGRKIEDHIEHAAADALKQLAPASSSALTLDQLRNVALQRKGMVESADKLTIDLTRIEVVDNYAQKAEIDFGHIFRGLWAERNKAVVLALILISIFVFGNKVILPDKYQSRALVSVNLANNNGAISDAGFAIQEVLSRTVLEKTVDDLDLTDPGTKQVAIQTFLAGIGVQTEKKRMNKDAVVMDLANNISVLPVDSEQNAGRVRLFSVSMQHEDPAQSARIVNGVVSSFLSTQGINRSSASNTAIGSLEKKIVGIDLKVGEFDVKIADIKTNNSDLVGQDGLLQNALIDGKMQLNETNSALREATGIAAHLRSSLALEPKTLALSGANNTLAIDNLSPSEQISIKRNMLASMRSKYTADHPHLVAMEQEIKELEIAIRTGKTNIVAGPPNPEYQKIRGELGVAESQIAASTERAKELRAQIAEYQVKLAKLPGVSGILADAEEKRSTLMREREELSTLLINENMKSGNGFTIVEAGAVPTLPLIRSRLITNSAGLFAGIVLSLILVTIYAAMRNSALRVVDFDITTGPTAMSRIKAVMFYLITSALFLYVLFYIISDHLGQLFVIK